MKFFRIIAITLVVMNVVSFSAPTYKLSENARGFLNGRHAMNGHRLNYRGVNKIDSRKSYVVNVEGTSQTCMMLKKSLQGKFEVNELKERVLEIRKKNYRLDISQNKKNHFDCAQRILKALLPENPAIQFDLLSVDTVRSFSMSQGIRDESYTFNFSRLYNNRIVRSDDNYLKVDVDNGGYLKWAQISMEDLSLTSEIVETDEIIDENEIVLDSVLRVDFDSVKDFDDNDGSVKDVKAESVEVGSVAASYCVVNLDDGKKLFPCVSYASKIKLANGKSFSYIIDAPHSRKSWEKFKHGKKNIRFAR